MQEPRISHQHPWRAAQPERPTVVAAFGDMGNVEADGAFHHSWDFENQGELPSLNTTVSLERDPAELVLHIGDISYAVGYMAEWDRFLQQLDPAGQGDDLSALLRQRDGGRASDPAAGTADQRATAGQESVHGFGSSGVVTGRGW